jgi:hypothetical protein
MLVLGNFPRELRFSPIGSHDPMLATPASLAPTWFGLFPVRSPLLGESRLFSFPGANEMFQFTPFARSGLCVHPAVHGHYPMWVSPFRNPRIKACLAAPRGLSQPSTPFIAGRRLGIHRLPLVAWPQNLRIQSLDSAKTLDSELVRACRSILLSENPVGTRGLARPGPYWDPPLFLGLAPMPAGKCTWQLA